ncbi:MAG: glutaminyl-peptide cyclotransferase [Planctomycetota bacterium]
MAKKNRARRNNSTTAAQAAEETTPAVPPGKRPFRWDLVIVFLTITIGGTYLALYLRPQMSAPEYTFEVIAEYPHDPDAFTQGFYIDEDCETIWESTGKYGQSTVRETRLSTGEVVNRFDLPEDEFGEGVTLWTDKDGNEQLVQLTWKAGNAYFYDKQLQLQRTVEYENPTQGWGITHDGTHLIVSSGTSVLRFLDPETLEEVRSIRVRNKGRGVNQLNELEYYNGKIFANQWQTDYIYEIDPAGGTVESVINLDGLWPYSERPSSECVLNGIAIWFDADKRTTRMFVTGKLCPKVWEIELRLKEEE